MGSCPETRNPIGPQLGIMKKKWKLKFRDKGGGKRDVLLG